MFHGLLHTAGRMTHLHETALEEQRNGEWRYLEFLQVTSWITADIFMQRYQVGREPGIGPAQLTCPNTDTDHSDQSVPVLFAPLFLEGRYVRRRCRPRPGAPTCPRCAATSPGWQPPTPMGIRSSGAGTRPGGA